MIKMINWLIYTVIRETINYYILIILKKDVILDYFTYGPPAINTITIIWIFSAAK